MPNSKYVKFFNNNTKIFIENKQTLARFNTAYYYKDTFTNIMFSEESLSRVWQHHKDSGFILCSAFKGQNTYEQNMEKHKELLQKIRSKKLGFFVVDGMWKDITTGETSNELGIFIPYVNNLEVSFEDFLEFAWSICKEFNQDAVLVKDPDPEYSKMFLLFNDGSTQTFKGRFNPNQITNIYSKLKNGKTFAFEGVQIPSSGWGEVKMLREGYLKI